MLLGLTRLLATQWLAAAGSALGMSVVKFAAADSETMSRTNAENLSHADGHPLIALHLTPV